ncbi:MAG: transglutaminase-like domain-containing protein [Candidatus Gracilibacteria bacterium]|nr:transglutaminase-like domain-containing protein [Candidatus Gracilibacteria bacterium]
MKFFKTLLTIFFISITFSAHGSYNDIDNVTRQLYTKFYSQIKAKYKSDDGFAYINLLDKSLDSISSGGKINSKNAKIIFDLQKLNNEKIFDLELEKKEKNNKILLQTNPLLSDFKTFYYNPDALILEDGVWYTYNFTKKYYFENISGVDKNSLYYNGLYSQNILVYYENGNINFVKEFKKEKIISDNLIYGFPDKYELLKTLRNNKLLGVNHDDDYNFLELEKISLNITKGIYNENEKIKIIYDYILKNISYSINFSLDDYEIFSGIDTFKNKNGVCEGYVEIFNLMLGFNNIKSKIIIGDVIDAVDFPQIGHAWVKIHDSYYDPTFDDPVGAEKTKIYSQYDYFKLPEDLFYTNRYDKGTTPEELKTTNMEYRKNLIKLNISKLVKKYENINYNLLKIYKFKDKYKIPYLKKITTNHIISILGVHDMVNFEINLNGETKFVKNINYATITDDMIENFLYQNNYDLSGYLLIKWIKNDGSFEYIITKEILYAN